MNQIIEEAVTQHITNEMDECVSYCPACGPPCVHGDNSFECKLCDLPAFVFGSHIFPGAAKLGEEMGELAQVLGKLQATGGARSHYDGSDLYERLQEEMADAYAALDFLAMHSASKIGLNELHTRRKEKRMLFEKWHADEVIEHGRDHVRTTTDSSGQAEDPEP